MYWCWARLKIFLEVICVVENRSLVISHWSLGESGMCYKCLLEVRTNLTEVQTCLHQMINLQSLWEQVPDSEMTNDSSEVQTCLHLFATNKNFY